MSIQINKKAYEQLIKEDIQALKNSNCSKLEKEHIEAVLKNSVDKLYKEQISKSALKGYLEKKKQEVLYIMHRPHSHRLELLDEMIDDLLANNIK